MPKLVRSLLVALVVCAAAPALASGPVRIVAPDPGSPFNFAELPSIVPTDEGFVVGWWRTTSPGDPGYPRNHAHVARFDVDGRRIGEATVLDVGYRLEPSSTYLEAVRNGFVFFAQEDAAQLYAAPLDAEARASGPSVLLVDSLEMYPFSVASNGNTLAMTYPEWNGTWIDWALEVGSDGAARGDRRIVQPGEITPEGTSGALWDSPAAPLGSGFVTAWYRGGSGLRLRRLSSHAVPSGDAEPLPSAPFFVRSVAAASDGRTVWVPHAGGKLYESDLWLTVWDAKTGPLPAAPLAATDRVEGSDSFDYIVHPIRAAAGDGRAAVLYVDESPFFDYPRDLRWKLVEVDTAGRPLGPARDLTAEFGVDAHEDVSLRFDSARGRYVLVWSRVGGDDPGVFFLALDPAP